MALKTYSLRLDEDEFEKLRQYLSDYGDPDLNVGFVIRSYIRDLNKALPDLKKSDLDLQFNLAFFGTMLRQFVRSAQIEGIVKGQKIIQKIKEQGMEEKK